MRPRDDDDCRVCGVFIVTIVTPSRKSKKKGKNRLMSNFRTAPKLYHDGNKKCKWFYFLSQKQVDAVFNRLDGKSGNMIKLMIVFMGTKGDGSFGISEKWICERTGMSKQNYHRALHGLEKLGLVTLKDKRITVNLKMLSYEEENDDEPGKPHQVGNGNHDDDHAGTHDDDYNKEDKTNNNKIINHESSTDEVVCFEVEGNELKRLFTRIGVDYSVYTRRTLEEIAKEELDPIVLEKLIERHASVWVRAKAKGQSYSFGVLKRIVENEYQETKAEIEKGLQSILDDFWGPEEFDVEGYSWVG